MTGPEQLAAYKKQIDADIATYCHDLLATTAEQYGPYSREAIAAFTTLFAHAGKRVRGALTIASYDLFGGTNPAVALQAARAAEMLHVYMLMLDDICDRSATRRGKPTAHVALAAYHRKRHLQGDADHFGVAVSLSATVVVSQLALKTIVDLPVTDANKIAALSDLNATFATTGHGQINDIFNEAVQEVGEDHVQNTLTWKTAYYSFLFPLQLGARLAGKEAMAPLPEYAQQLGLAFQIVDDILGTFGNEFETGKSALDDIREGKITLLSSYALAHATPPEQAILRAALGNSALVPAELETCKAIMKRCGALAYAQAEAKRHAVAAQHALVAAPLAWDTAHTQFLRWLAAYAAERNV